MGCLVFVLTHHGPRVVSPEVHIVGNAYVPHPGQLQVSGTAFLFLKGKVLCLLTGTVGGGMEGRSQGTKPNNGQQIHEKIQDVSSNEENANVIFYLSKYEQQ